MQLTKDLYSEYIKNFYNPIYKNISPPISNGHICTDILQKKSMQMSKCLKCMSDTIAHHTNAS